MRNELIRYILSFLGGGGVAALGNWIHASWTARRQREAAWLQEQIRSLYGPLSFFTTQNEQLFRLCGNIDAAYSAFFNRGWSQDERTQKTLRKEADSTIALQNAYAEQAAENSQRAMAVLEANWHLVDPEDADVLSQFQVDHIRFTIEVKEQRAREIPIEIARALGPIAYMRPDMVDCIRTAVRRKRARLAGVYCEQIPS
jgi:hypothetical protein